eukprot:TRINITY_DN37028_c0_g1_i1.p1 TRINITY_DN37028_c0_g1~~TRINITY_DN37028_c0_g1_i1.p1  ORF type:complete len:619 (-),score=107.37 TRINITY_DN37028_c0_g1_i1:26-1882(-)
MARKVQAILRPRAGREASASSSQGRSRPRSSSRSSRRGRSRRATSHGRRGSSQRSARSPRHCSRSVHGSRSRDGQKSQSSREGCKRSQSCSAPSEEREASQSEKAEEEAEDEEVEEDAEEEQSAEKEQSPEPESEAEAAEAAEAPARNHTGRRRRKKSAQGDGDGEAGLRRRRKRRRSQAEVAEARSEDLAPADQEKQQKKEQSKTKKVKRRSGEAPIAHDAATRSRLIDLIRTVYEKCNPSKLRKLPSILKKYDGLEHEVYRKACNKYGVTPEIDVSRLVATAKANSAEASKGFAKKASAPPPPSIAGPGAPKAEKAGKAPKPPKQAGAAWPFMEEFSGNSSDSEVSAAAGKEERPPGAWVPPRVAGNGHMPGPAGSWYAPPLAWPRPPVHPATPSSASAPGPWLPPTCSPGAWVPPTAAPAAPKAAPSSSVPPVDGLDPDLKDLLYGDVAATPRTAPPAPVATSMPQASPFDSRPRVLPGPPPPPPPRPLPTSLATPVPTGDPRSLPVPPQMFHMPDRGRPPADVLHLEDFLGDWHDTMGNLVSVDWSRSQRNRGELDVALSKPRSGRDPIRLNVKQLSAGRFACGHYELEVGKSNPHKIVWVDCRNQSKTSVWER